MRRIGLVLFISCLAGGIAVAAESFTITDAINQAVATNPAVGEAAANRRATESELRQVQSTLLPQVRLQAEYGDEKQDRVVLPQLGNDTWHTGRRSSVLVRQLLFDGFASVNEIWRQAARVDAAASRVHERTELIALDAAEAYIDVVRYLRIVAIAQENVAAHRRILDNVEARFTGGRAGEGDMQQARERVAAAEAALAEFRLRLDESRAKYRNAVGLEPYNVRFPGRLRGLPGTKDESLAVALQHNPTIRAAQADATAAKYGFHATAGAFVPNVALEGRASRGHDTDFILGSRDELTGKVVISWDVFRGGQDNWRRAELAERYTESTMRHARLQRAAFEALDKAWAARTVTNERTAALTRQVEADRRVISAYTKEYELGQRSLIDLLNAQNQLFTASVALVSTRGVAVFADYQLLAAMGHLLTYLKTAPPPEAEPLDARPIGPVPVRLAPVILNLPEPSGPEPLNVGGIPPRGEPLAPAPVRLSERWPPYQLAADPSVADRWMPTAQAGSQARPEGSTPIKPSSVLSFAAEVMQVPVWPIRKGN